MAKIAEMDPMLHPEKEDRVEDRAQWVHLRRREVHLLTMKVMVMDMDMAPWTDQCEEAEA